MIGALCALSSAKANNLQDSVLQKTDTVAPVSKVPFDGMDLTWINGQNRQKNFPLSYKDIITGVVYADTYFNYNFANPKDNTQTISSTIGRTNEFTINLVSVGLDLNYKNVIGRVLVQTGQMLEIIQQQDGTVTHGRNTSTTNLRYIREAAAGYHFNKWYGINVEMGIFMSYIGLESYVTQENWSYQRSMVCDFTPFYFSGARAQLFPAKNFRTELWLLNGFQTYNTWNKSLGFGSSNYYRPNENIQLVANFYYGKDTRNSDRVRFHHDNSVVYRYFKNPESKGLSMAAFSINNHYGFQNGDGVKPKDQHMIGTSIANRLWFLRNKLGLTLRGDVVSNPGTYLAFTPSPVTPNDYTDALAADPKQKLTLWQQSATIDIMPNDHVTFRLEYGRRTANVPHFPGPGGTTSPDGWQDTSVKDWRPDLRKSENRLTFAINIRI